MFIKTYKFLFKRKNKLNIDDLRNYYDQNLIDIFNTLTRKNNYWILDNKTMVVYEDDQSLGLDNSLISANFLFKQYYYVGDPNFLDNKLIDDIILDIKRFMKKYYGLKINTIWTADFISLHNR